LFRIRFFDWQPTHQGAALAGRPSGEEERSMLNATNAPGSVIPINLAMVSSAFFLPHAKYSEFPDLFRIRGFLSRFYHPAPTSRRLTQTYLIERD
jgi:hypothetical protein